MELSSINKLLKSNITSDILIAKELLLSLEDSELDTFFSRYGNAGSGPKIYKFINFEIDVDELDGLYKIGNVYLFFTSNIIYLDNQETFSKTSYVSDTTIIK